MKMKKAILLLSLNLFQLLLFSQIEVSQDEVPLSIIESEIGPMNVRIKPYIIKEEIDFDEKGESKEEMFKRKIRALYRKTNGQTFTVSYKSDYDEGIHKLIGKTDLKSESFDLEFFYPNGNQKAKGKIIKGYQSGKWSYYHLNGKLEHHGLFDKSGKTVGEWKGFYEDGTYKIGNFEKGLKNGKWVYYSKKGKVRYEGLFKNSDYEGTWKWFNKKGKVTKIKVFEYGQLKQEGAMKKGKKNGEWIEYFVDRWGMLSIPPTKKIFKIGHYKKGKKIGEWKEYDKEGNLKSITEFRKGVEIN